MQTASVVTALLVAGAVLVAGGSSGRRLREAMGEPPGRQGPEAPAGRPTDVPAVELALVMDLVAAGLAAGLPPARALQVAAASHGGVAGEAVGHVAALWLLGAAPPAAWEGSPPELAPLRRVLDIVALAGVPGVPLLRLAADELRRSERRRAEARAQALGVRMVLPIGLCALPAFVAWAVVPVVLSLAAQVLR